MEGMPLSHPASPAAADAGLARGAAEPAPPEFPGCRAVRMTRDAITDFEGRFEYWDAATETAWMVCEPTTIYHEGPGQRLAQLAALIAAGRGSPITTLGTADLLVRNARGERQRILQADQIVYLRPTETEPRGAAVEVGADHLPDVVLEVDWSTDVRRGKLGLYEAWGFPEVWVEVPDAGSPGRSQRRAAGLTIHRLGADGYRPAAASEAFPGWTAAEIHTALNESRLSEATSAVLTRVGRALGDAEGTVPDDHPWLRGQRRETARKAKREGKREGKQEATLEAVMRVLRSRGIAVPPRLAALAAGASPAELIDAALACRDAADFLLRLKRRSDRSPG